jgi:hypothetical protein
MHGESKMNKQEFFPRISILISLIFLFLVAIGPVAATYDSIVDIPTDLVAVNPADINDVAADMPATSEELARDLGVAESAATQTSLSQTSVPHPQFSLPEPIIPVSLPDAAARTEDMEMFRGGILIHGEST